MRRCLFVDDEPLILSSIGRLLRGASCETVLCHSPAEALAVCSASPIDVVVSDFMMPAMNGTELLGAIRRVLPSSLRFLLTGHAPAQVTAEALRDGTIHGVLTKPFDRATLLRAVSEGPRSARET